MTALVSILIPAHNAQAWIGDAVKSALEQTWPKKEIIIVDDGSTDGTLMTARRFESKALKVLTQPRQGASAARNRALSVAQGDYIQWLDADDLLAPDKISEQLKKTDVSGESRILQSSAWGTFYFRSRKARFVPTPLWHDLAPVEWLLVKFNDGVWMNPAVWLLSRKLTELAGPWDERLSLNDDGEYFARVVACSEEVRFVNEAKSYYRRVNSGSLSGIVSDKAMQSLYLSTILSTGHLRSMEDSPRTRVASIRALQDVLIYFYPENTEILAQARAFAEELGGQLPPPSLRGKYFIIKQILGWRTARLALRMIPRSRERIWGNWDKLFYNLGNKRFRPSFLTGRLGTSCKSET